MAALLVSVVAALFVVTRFVFGLWEGVAVGVLVFVAAVALWYLVPLRRHLQESG
jgi:hypothetical protein